MERSNDGAYGRTQNIPSGRAFEAGRPSVEATYPSTPRLQKKSSNAGVRNASQPLSRTDPGLRGSAIRASGQSAATNGSGDGGKARKGSLRDAMRKFFGKRSREVEPQAQGTQQRSPPQHRYHGSEPPTLAPPAEAPELSQDEEDLPQRTLSAPFEMPSPSFQRVRSPYAVEFPQSAKLKPLNLGNPFTAPGSQLRRRKTLPSILVPESEASALSESIRSTDVPPVPSFEITRDAPTPEASLAVGKLRTSEKRRSRSADDLKGAVAEASPPRKRSEEIREHRVWRDSLQGSIQGSVLRASGFTSFRSASLEQPREEDRTPMARTGEPFSGRWSRSGTVGTFGSGALFQPGPSFSEIDIRSTSGDGTELSRDLEDRVAKLEAGLQTFQRSLHRLTAERNRRTVMIGGIPQRRSSSDMRTPSMLADTLRTPLEPSTYQYDYTETQRPSTSPQPPRTPVRSADPVPPLPAAQGADQPFSTSSPPPVVSMASALGQPTAYNGGSGGNGNGQMQQHTFRSLYEMLTDERSARRRLESQLRGLQSQIQNLQYQVSVGSQGVQSQRSSYIHGPLDPMVGSSRLRELLGETEASPPRTAESQQQQQQQQQQHLQRNSGATGVTQTSDQPGIISRFSGSESEVGGIAESEDLSIQTPYEAYQTPREERSRYHLSGDRSPGTEGEMF